MRFPARFLGFSLLVTLLMMTSVATTFAQRNLKEIPEPDPELERKTFILPEGFEVNLYASDPLLAKPIQMNFDAQGKLWVVSSSVYPHIKPGQTANDKVLVLEDSNADGKADKTTVFADGLLIPTGIEPGDGGAYVANSTQLLHFKDTNGDGKADKTRIVLSGFGTEDTHHILHTLRWGPAGRLYMNQSIYIHSHIETPYGVKRLNGGGIWQFRPETLELNVVARGLINPWGHHFDEWGQSFATDGAGGEGINYMVREAAYRTAVGVKKILPGLNPGSPKYCGLEIGQSEHLPDDWQNCFLTNDFRGHRVCRFKLSENGSGYVSREQVELIKSSHVAFRPVDIKIGPDGAIYIADWYNPIIQHGEVDFRDPRRDHVHGRIWRVTYKKKPLVKTPDLLKLSTLELLEQLTSPNLYTRHFAKRVLKERGPDVLPEVKKWIAGLEKTHELYERHLLEGMWVFQSHQTINHELLQRLLSSPDHHVRAAAARIVGDQADELPDAIALLTPLVRDEHPQVRLEAVRSLGHLKNAAAMTVAMRALDYPTDQFLDYALWLTARELKPYWLPLVQTGKPIFGNNLSHLTFALKAADSPAVTGSLLTLLTKQETKPDQQIELVKLIASLGNPAELGQLYRWAMLPEQKESTRIAVLNALTEPGQNQRPAGDLSSIETALNSSNPELQMAAIQAIGLWKLTAFQQRLLNIADDQQTKLALRATVLEALAKQNPAFVIPLLKKFSEDSQPVAVRMMAVNQSIITQAAIGIERAVALLPELNEPQAEELFLAILARKNAPALFQKAVAGKTLPADIARVGLRVVEGSGQELPELTAALRTAGKITTGPRVLSPAETAEWVALVNSEGDAHRGEAIFRREKLGCMKCHAIGGAGGKVGPDLVSLGASAQVDYLLESLLQPNKKIKENYQTLVVLLETGKIINGIKLRQTDTELILRDAENREFGIPLKSIEEQQNGRSLMPDGLTETLTKTELIDLTRFLSELGKVGDFAINKTPLVRRWQVMQATPEASFKLRRVSYAAAATDDSAFLWNPTYSTVAGVLPLETLPEIHVRNRSAPGTMGISFVRFELEVVKAGPFQFKLANTAGLSMWVGEKPVTLAAEIPLNLPVGKHRVTLAVDHAQRKQPLKIELVEQSDSPASNSSPLNSPGQVNLLNGL